MFGDELANDLSEEIDQAAISRRSVLGIIASRVLATGSALAEPSSAAPERAITPLILPPIVAVSRWRKVTSQGVTIHVESVSLGIADGGKNLIGVKRRDGDDSDQESSEEKSPSGRDPGSTLTEGLA